MRFIHLMASIFIWICWLCLLSSCAPTITSVKQPTKTAIYQSEDYVLYRLDGSETPQHLAERFLGDKKSSWKIEEANPDQPFLEGQLITIPLKDKNKGGLSANGYQIVPVLTYHRFSGDCSSHLCIADRIFDQQMRYLKENGYHVITPDDLLAFLEYRYAIPKKSVMITMDDGFRSVYEIAYPILKTYGFTATLFIYTDYIGVSDSAITWEQLREMKASGFTIGSHTMTHADLTLKMEGETDHDFLARIKRELSGSKEIIDQKLGQDTFLLAYPFGKYDQRAMECSRQAGYTVAMTVKRGGNAFFVDPLSLRRDQILTEDMNLFLSTLITFHQMSLE
ncbi:MAG: polysaccharide deacetylase family protein [Deltaproteobacteria bacterium]|nr:polysaccharide deacetylase family protein [Deltaproteobacteria bacterium]